MIASFFQMSCELDLLFQACGKSFMIASFFKEDKELKKRGFGKKKKKKIFCLRFFLPDNFRTLITQ